MEGHKRTAVFDIDGCLSDNSNYKSWRDEKGDFEAEKFEEQLPRFKTLEWGVALAKALHSQRYRIILITSRRDGLRGKTMKWLQENKIPWDELNTRPEKQDFIEHKLERAAKYKEVLLIVEDSPEIVKAYRNEGYTVLQPNNYYED